jgi:hypothetical protein
MPLLAIPAVDFLTKNQVQFLLPTPGDLATQSKERPAQQCLVSGRRAGAVPSPERCIPRDTLLRALVPYAKLGEPLFPNN